MVVGSSARSMTSLAPDRFSVKFNYKAVGYLQGIWAHTASLGLSCNAGWCCGS